MPALLMAIMGYLVGCALGWPHREQSGAAAAELSWQKLAITASLGLLVYAPTCAFVVALSPDWAISYLLSAERVGVPLQAAITLAAAATVPIGYVSMLGLSPGSLAWLKRTLPAAVVGLTAALAGLPRLSSVGSHAQYHGGFGLRPLSTSAVGAALALGAVITVLAALWSYRALGQLGGVGAKN